jgi:phage terminase large subunit
MSFSPLPIRGGGLLPRRPITDVPPLSEAQVRAQAIKDTIDDPKLFFENYLGVQVWNTQAEILYAVDRYPRVAVKACHASSKTFSAARLVLWFLQKHQDEAVVITTAPTWNQVEMLLWGEIRSALLTSKIKFPTPNLTKLEISPKRLAYGLSTAVTRQDEGVKIQGIHGKNVLVIIDEAPGLNPKIWEAIEGARAGGNVRVLALGNPTIASGPFHTAFVDQRIGWKTITIDAFETPNFQDIPGGLEFVDEHGKLIEDESSRLWNLLNLPEESLASDTCDYLITRRWVKERYYEWGLDHPSWQSRVRGRFPTQSEDALLSLAWLEEQKIREIKEKDSDEIVAGLDVAGPGDDETSLTIRKGPKVIFHEATAEKEPRGWVMMRLLPYKDKLKAINIDVIGVGYNMYTHIADTYKDKAVDINVCNTSNDSEKYSDLKSEYFWGLRMRLQQGDFCGLTDEKTIGQLAGIRWKPNSRGQIQIESKEDARKRGVKSPDRAESIMLAFAGVTKLYGALSYYKDLEKTMHKVQSSILVKPVTNDKTLCCPQCNEVCVSPNNNGWRCGNCGHQWATDKKQLPSFSRSDMLIKMGGRGGFNS